MTWETTGLWGEINDEEDRGYLWKKETRDNVDLYVCYHATKEIGFIPIRFSPQDQEWASWWDAAYKRFNNDLCLKYLMDEIVNRYEKRIDGDICQKLQ